MNRTVLEDHQLGPPTGAKPHHSGNPITSMQASRSLFIAILLGFGLVACGQSPQDQLTAARASLASSDYAAAIETADAGLAASPDDVTAWGLELVKLEALSRSGDGAGTVAQLSKLAEANAERLTASEYSGTAQLLRTADAKTEAIEVLDLGAKRFPDDATILKMIEDSKGSVDPAELEMLKSLGYID